MKAQINAKNIFAYIQGNIRYKLYYSKYFSWLIPQHIKEQIDCRIKSMKRECYETGSCIICGCQTTHLQMADKPCDGNCYPHMLSRKEWKDINNSYIINVVSHNEIQLWKLDKGLFWKITDYRFKLAIKPTE